MSLKFICGGGGGKGVEVTFIFHTVFHFFDVNC